ncbi:phage tail spike protein [Cytobacillus oceanisediminis]|uniref:Tail spike domain-containing protein n=1 Tax=Cytobacillus oceanisediminis 2691 TaxID=1196031 RepID=A0A160M8W6_9BACI|nr:phage tail spike protein [Cytobacillus oceanisediminis]AND39050.1 hypothetical protein A361_07955 [Cytobacillus oceanisediminis 2691]
MIHVADGLTDKIWAVIDLGEFWDDIHYKSLRDSMETFDFVTFGDKPFASFLSKRNRVVIPDEDGRYLEFIISNTRKYRTGQGAQYTAVKANASYLDLRKAKVISPGKRSSQSLSTLTSLAIGGTEWRAGRLEGYGTRTINIEKYTDPYSLLKMIATEFNLELQFRIEVRSNRIIGRYVDLVKRVGDWRGREVEFGQDLVGIERIEDADNIVTALVGIGPEREDGTRLEVTVSDSDAWQRWGRVDPVTGQRAHIIETYEPQSNDQGMTLERLTTLTESELQKRINTIIQYTAEAADLENVPGLKNKKVRFGDSIRVKDSKFEPPVYLDARVHTQERSISDPSKKKFVLGDFIEYSEEDIHALWNSMQLEIQRKLAKLLIVNVESSAGHVFKNGAGTTTLTSRVFLTGTEVDEDGDLYSYSWTKHDKNGVRDMAFARAGKSIAVASSDVDTKATFFVDIGFQGEVIQTGQFTIADLYDGQNGADGQSLYTWVKYADNASGNGMSEYPEGKAYIGLAYNRPTSNESSNPADYEWSLIQGPQGVQGPAGADGKPTYTWIKYAESASGTGMSDSPTGKSYIGLAHNKTTSSESSNPADYTWAKFLGPQGVPGPPGNDGQTLYTWIKYADDELGNGMSEIPTGKSYIGIAYNKTDSTESSNPSEYTWSKFEGNQGVPGPAGKDGTTYYTWIKYADSPTSGMSDSPAGKKYMGIAYNKTTATESTSYADYSWSLIQGPQGDQGPQGQPGFVLSWNTTGTVYVDPQGRLSKLTGSSTWDSQAYSTESYTGGAFLTFKAGVNANNIMIGLNSDPATDASYTSIDYAFYLRSAGTFSFYESGESRGTAIPFSVGDVFSVVYDNTEVRYYHNGNLVRSVAASSGLTLSVDSSFATASSKSPHIYDLYFSPAAAKGPQGPVGPQGPNIVDSTTQIEANIIKANHIDVSNLSAIVANLGKVTAGELTGVKLETDDGLGSKVIINNGEIEAFRNGNKIAAINKRGFHIYDDQVNDDSVGIIRDQRGTESGDLSLAINSYRDGLDIGFMIDDDLARPWISMSKKYEETIISGTNIPGIDRGRLILKSTREGGTADQLTPMMKLNNYTTNGGTADPTYWSGVIVNTGRDNSTPNASNKRFGFEVWQYRGTGNGAEKQMMRVDTDVDGTTYAAFYTDKSYIPRPLLRADNDQYYWAAGAQIASRIEDIHGVQNANTIFFVTETDITLDGQNLVYKDFSFSGAENIFHVIATPYNNNSYRVSARIYNQSSTGFRIYLPRHDTSTTNYTITVRLLIIFEP